MFTEVNPYSKKFYKSMKDANEKGNIGVRKTQKKER
jgi:hypothetical protein